MITRYYVMCDKCGMIIPTGNFGRHKYSNNHSFAIPLPLSDKFTLPGKNINPILIKLVSNLESKIDDIFIYKAVNYYNI